MSIFVIGIDHQTAPLALREKLFFAKDLLPLYLQDLLAQGITQEAVLLSTCNRSELFCETEDFSGIRAWFFAQTVLTDSEVAAITYEYHEEEAVAHLMEVACGLKSMILGEPQILGQMKEAFSESCTVGAVNTLFHRLFQQIFNVAKEIRTATAIGACPVSVASAATHFAKQQVATFPQSEVVLIGAGDTTIILMRYLSELLLNPITLVNRNQEKAEELADEWGGRTAELSGLSAALSGADVVFSATGSILPIIHKEMVAQAMQGREDRPLLLIDIAVPRDIDPQVATLNNVKLFCIDDLKGIIETNRQGREHAAEKARDMIRQKSLEFITEARSLEKMTHTIRAYRGQIEEICNAELHKAKLQMQQGMDPVLVLESFANAYTKKLLHAPSVQLRKACIEGHVELLRFAKQLFAIPDMEIERL